jgi:dipeptidyl aminopeptidase/acylaminoacyl peptidase
MKHIAVMIAAASIVVLSIPYHVAATEKREVGNLVLDGIPETPDSVVEALNRYQHARIASLRSWLPDGRGILITTRFGETYQIHRVAQPGGARIQTTFFSEPTTEATASPNPQRNGYIFRSDIGGSENYQLLYHDMDTGISRRITSGEGRNGAALWSNDGNRFAYYTTRRNGRDWDVHVASIDAPTESRGIVEKDGTWFPADWSPDDTKLLVGKYVSANEDYIYVYDLATGDLVEVDPSNEPISRGNAIFDGDGTGVYVTSDKGAEFKRLRHVDLKTGHARSLTDDIPWDIEEVALSDDGRWLAFVANADGISTLYVYDTVENRRVELPDIPVGQIYKLMFEPNAARLGMVFNTPRTPGDTYTLGLPNGKLVRWTYSEVGGLNTDLFAVPDLIRYDTFDSIAGAPRTIPAFVYRPVPETGHTPPYPVLIDIHGGPESQGYPYFNTTKAVYTNELGFTVIQPNVRGSSGYGKSYVQLDNGMRREDSVRDIGALLDWIAGQPDLDASRVVVAGGSYGGYMSLACMVHYGDRLKAGISTVGISNFVTFLENTKEYRQDLRRVEYGDERDPEMREFLIGISPTTNAHLISRPLLIGQGLNDPRVPAGEAEQMVDAVRGNNGDAWYFLAKDEGHGFSKKTNRDAWRAVKVHFLRQHVLE